MTTIRKWAVGILMLITLALALCSAGYWYIFHTSEAPAIRRLWDPYGFIDKTGRLVLDLQNTQDLFVGALPKRFSNGLCKIYGRHGNSASDINTFANYADKSGKLLSPDFCYYAASDFSDGLAAVIDFSNNADRLPRLGVWRRPGDDPNYRWTFIDMHGKTKSGPFCKVQDYAQGLAGVKLDGEPFWKFIDKEGNCVIAGKFEKVTPFSEDRAGILVHGKWGLIDRTGKLVLKPSYISQIHPFQEGLAAAEVLDASRIDYLNRDGTIRFSLERHSETGPLKNTDASGGFVVFEKNHKFGFADLSGKPIIPPTFDYCWPFSDGRALVCQKSAGKDRFGYIDRLGSLVIPCKYLEAFPFAEGYAVVTTDTRSRYYKYIDQSGRECFGGKDFPRAQSFHEGRAFVGSEYIEPFPL
ncbi:MAG: WG repeat-containing protein [Candidatus Obscuribacterales bacterium]